MKVFNKFIWLSAIFLLAASALTAQEDVLRPKGKPEGYGDDFFSYRATPWAIGVEIGANYNMYSQDVIPTYVDEARYATVNNTFKSLSGISPHFGVVVDYSFNSVSALQARIGFENRTFSNKDKGNAFNLSEEGVPSELEIKYESIWMNFALLYRHSFTSNFFGTIGFLSEEILDGGTEELTLHTLDGTPVSQIKSGWTSLTDTETLKVDVPDSGYVSPRVALEIGAGYKFHIGDRLSIVPQARFQYFLTKPNEDTYMDDYPLGRVDYKNAKLNGLQLVVALWYNL